MESSWIGKKCLWQIDPWPDDVFENRITASHSDAMEVFDAFGTCPRAQKVFTRIKHEILGLSNILSTGAAICSPFFRTANTIRLATSPSDSHDVWQLMNARRWKTDDKRQSIINKRETPSYWMLTSDLIRYAPWRLMRLTSLHSG